MLPSKGDDVMPPPQIDLKVESTDAFSFHLAHLTGGLPFKIQKKHKLHSSIRRQETTYILNLLESPAICESNGCKGD